MTPAERRSAELAPGGIPKWIRVYDNGGGLSHFCRPCLTHSDEEACPDCGRPTIETYEPQGEIVRALRIGTFDRYTVLFTGNYPERNGQLRWVDMSRHPFHPQGYGQHGCSCGPSFDVDKWGFPTKVGDMVRSDLWNGYTRRITFHQLPVDCQVLVLGDYARLWNLTVITTQQRQPA